MGILEKFTPHLRQFLEKYRRATVQQSAKANGAATRYQNLQNSDNGGNIKTTQVSSDGKNYRASIKAEEQKIYKDDLETATVIDDRGNVVFTATSKAKDHVLFTPEQLSKMKGNTLTHNHPSNSTFSGDDVALMVAQELRVIRATGKKRTYQLERSALADEKTFLQDFKTAKVENKKVTDKLYAKLVKKRNNGNISYTEYEEQVQGLNDKLNELNSNWLKENAKRYGFRYGIIERK